MFLDKKDIEDGYSFNLTKESLYTFEYPKAGGKYLSKIFQK